MDSISNPIGVMTPAETFQSRQDGTTAALAIRATEKPAETFRFPHALLMLAIGHRRMNIVGSFKIAIERALEWSTNPALNETDANEYVRKLVREHKRELAERRSMEAGA